MLMAMKQKYEKEAGFVKKMIISNLTDIRSFFIQAWCFKKILKSEI